MTKRDHQSRNSRQPDDGTYWPFPAGNCRAASRRAEFTHHVQPSGTGQEESETTPHIDAQELAGRYAAVWNERDPELRRRAVHALWSPDGVHALLPPQELRESAVRLGFPTAAL
ncbi:hypothetical protein [Streptomyces sp. NBC_00009]|uniref:hypothetical protein n=1 Tax=Streptomyces sp. NBC_00009 TaxID=2975620 RepID=UPI003251AD5D